MNDQPTSSGSSVNTWQWLAFGICFLCSYFAGTISTLMSVYLPDVVNSLSSGVNFDEVSAWINSLYLVGWAIGGLFFGFLADRMGRARGLSLALGTLGLFTFLTVWSASWEMVVLCRLISGCAVGGILVITPTYLSEIWPPASRSIIIGIDSIGFPIGIISSGMMNVLTSDWRLAFLIGLVAVVLAIFSLFILRESGEWAHARSRSGRELTYNSEDISNLIRGAVIFGSMLIGLWAMFSWIPTWVQSLLAGVAGNGQRGIAMILLGAGGLAGGFASGWISNRLGVRRSMLLCFMGCFVTSLVLFGLNRTFSYIIYAELALLAVFFGISQGLLSIFIPQLFPNRIRGTFTGICFNIGRFVTAAAVFFVGFLVSTFGGYGNTLLFFTGVFVLGFIAVLMTAKEKEINPNTT